MFHGEEGRYGSENGMVSRTDRSTTGPWLGDMAQGSWGKTWHRGHGLETWHGGHVGRHGTGVMGGRHGIGRVPMTRTGEQGMGTCTRLCILQTELVETR